VCVHNWVWSPPRKYSRMTKLYFYPLSPQNPRQSQNGAGGTNQSTHRATTQDKKSIILLFAAMFWRDQREFAPGAATPIPALPPPSFKLPKPIMMDDKRRLLSSLTSTTSVLQIATSMSSDSSHLLEASRKIRGHTLEYRFAMSLRTAQQFLAFFVLCYAFLVFYRVVRRCGCTSSLLPFRHHHHPHL
jgi:hypothetical protein